jgi:hypothetical protein
MAVAMAEVFETAHLPVRGTVISSFLREQKRRIPSVPLSKRRWQQIERPKRGGVLGL